MSEPRTEPVQQDDPFKELLAGWCGKPWKPTRRIGNFLWCPHCHALQRMHDIGVACAAIDARHAEEIAAKDREIHSLRTALNRAFDDLVTLRREIAAKDAEHQRYFESAQHLQNMASGIMDQQRAENTTLREQLAAVQQALRMLRNESHGIRAMSYDAIKDSAGYTNLKVWTQRIEEADAILAALSSPSTQEPATVCEWRDISTAPKDGTYVLLCEREWKGPGVFVTMGRWQAQERALQGDAGWVRYGVGNIASERLTHWMPLPSLPLKLSPESEKEPRS